MKKIPFRFDKTQEKTRKIGKIITDVPRSKSPRLFSRLLLFMDEFSYG
jgi:hypothetical protein